jgi:hypothetical protein
VTDLPSVELNVSDPSALQSHRQLQPKRPRPDNRDLCVNLAHSTQNKVSFVIDSMHFSPSFFGEFTYVETEYASISSAE